MVKAGNEIVNPRTAQRMVFLETGHESGGHTQYASTPSTPLPVSRNPSTSTPFRRAALRYSPVRCASALAVRSIRRVRESR
jgi:hypothetical protein